MELISEQLLAETLATLKPQIELLDAAVRASAESLEGNILYMHQSFEPNPKNVAKQRNLFSLAQSLPKEDAMVVEIGFNAGHSSLLMLAAHPTLQIIAFDLCEHSYTKPCSEVLTAAFPGRLQLVSGRSQQTLPSFVRASDARADLLHIDGDHHDDAARTDLENAAKLARPGAVVVFDDICFAPLAAVWREAHEKGLLEQVDLQLCPTNRHGVAKYTRPAPKASEELLWDLAPALGHRGLQRHVLVLAPTDHGQDSLLGYLTKHCAWRGRAPKGQKLAPNTVERHQSPWLSLPLRWQPPEQVPTLVHLVAPPFYDAAQISDCVPLADGILAVVDCSVGLTDEFRNNFRAATQRGLQPVLLLNKLDKLLSLEPDNETCYQRLEGCIAEVNGLLAGTPAKPLQVMRGSVLFGRGSLSVAEGIGGWGFTVQHILQVYAARKGWTAEQLESFAARAWGDRTITGRERGFCALVLRPLRELFTALEAGYEEGSAKLEQLGVAAPEHLPGNAWKQAAAEAWLPLSGVLLREVCRHVPAPASTVGGPFYAAKSVSSADGRSHFAFGRRIAAPLPGLATHKAGPGPCSFLNGAMAVEVPTLQAGSGTLLGVPLGAQLTGPGLVEL